MFPIWPGHLFHREVFVDTKAKIQIYDNKEAQLEEINLPHQDV